MPIDKITVHMGQGSLEETMNDIKILLWSLGFETEDTDGKVVVHARDTAKLQTPTIVLDFSGNS